MVGAMTRRIFLLAPGRSAAGVLRAGVHSTLHGVVFAIFCPGPAVHRRRDGMPGPGQCLALTGRIDPVPTHHALGLAEARRHPHASNARSGHVGSRIGHDGMVAMLRPYSGLMPAARTTLPHFSVSSEISLPNSAGGPPSGSPPMAANRAFIPGSAIAALISLLSLSTISAGVFAGAPRPYHWVVSYPGTKSPTVGSSGKSSAREADVTASARSLPVAM